MVHTFLPSTLHSPQLPTPFPNRIRVADIKVHPVIGTEADPTAHLEINAGVPVDDDEDVHDQVYYSERVRVVGTRLGQVEELEHPVHAENPGGGVIVKI